MIGLLIAAGILVALVILARILYTWNDSRRARAFEEHLDENFETVTEHRIRRNFFQGG